MIRKLATALATTTCFVALATPAAAQTREFNVAAGSLRTALDTFARQSGRQVIYRGDEVRSAKSPGVRGAHTADDALEVLLAGTGFVAKKDASGAFAVVKVGNASATPETTSSSGEGGENEIIVTGTNIRGVEPSSPVLQVTQKQMVQAGHADLGEVIRSIPQNFSGGQNPGVISVGGGGINNQNANSGSSINLRGLGPDATLTLLNGHRLSYGFLTQAVDLSVIPLAAIDRIQIALDGASAIYGSDAVAGVANVILRRDYDGLTTSARIGFATDGGGTQQDYNIVGGRVWDTGGLIATYGYKKQNPVSSTQRDYTEYLPSPYTLQPEINQHNALISFHQDLGTFATISTDAFYNHRNSEIVTTDSSQTFTYSKDENYAIAPTIKFNLPADWTMSLDGVYAKEDNLVDTERYSLAGALTNGVSTCYCNALKTAELSAEGLLFRLPGGGVRAALGAGYRRSDFVNYASNTSVRIVGKRASRYAYGELFIPLVSEAQGLPFIYRLSVDAAARYEDYDDLGDIMTPKLGVVYAPSADIEFKGSWGKSFKAPTLYQQFSQFSAYLFPAATLGGSSFPATGTALVAFGGNPSLKPEKATTWSVGPIFHPVGVPGLRIEANYFQIKYNERVVQPVANLTSAFTSPEYAPFLGFNPTVAQQQALLNMAPAGLINLTAGATYNPANVVAIIYDQFTNVARQDIKGVDLGGNYTIEAGPNRFDLMFQASWLKSRQRTSAAAGWVNLAGTIYNPATFRLRSGATYSGHRFTASAFANYIGGLDDTRFKPAVRGDGMLTFDVAVIYRVPPETGLTGGIELSLAIQNLTNKRPPYLSPSANYFINYDSTNYSSIGRFVSFTITKRW